MAEPANEGRRIALAVCEHAQLGTCVMIRFADGREYFLESAGAARLAANLADVAARAAAVRVGRLQ